MIDNRFLVVVADSSKLVGAVVLVGDDGAVLAGESTDDGIFFFIERRRFTGSETVSSVFDDGAANEFGSFDEMEGRLGGVADTLDGFN